MNDIFYDEEHEEFFTKFIEKDNTKIWDFERISLFYLLALNEGTRININTIYNFKEHWINRDSIEASFQTSSSTRITRLAFNLYNGFKEDVDVLNSFAYIDRDKFYFLFTAIKLRFNEEEPPVGPKYNIEELRYL